ncbi:MAG: DUF2207 domain-containing protein [Clostridia bacterium]|nr:DUF2207 domain-containing protein [Clostridia bacterium]
MPKIKNKKYILSSFLFFLFFTILVLPLTSINASAKEGYKINTVKVNVDLQKDGSAKIVETWDVYVDEITDATEWYLIKGNLDGSKISNLEVVDETGKKYENIGYDWDVNDTRTEKAGKCGYNKNDSQKGVELCWGIGQYGHHTFTVSYEVTQLVDGYKDKDGFNWRFINDKMTAVPEQVSVTITAPENINDENADIWMFGNTGQINFKEKDGRQLIFAEAYGEDYNSYDHHVTIVVSFEKGIFTPEKTFNKDIKGLINKAKKGSSYKNPFFSFLGNLLNIIFALFVPALIFFIAILASKRSGINPKLKISSKEKREADYYRDLPMKGNIEATYSGLDALDELNSSNTRGNIVSAYLLKWLNEKKIIIKNAEAKKFLGLGTKIVKSVIFNVDSLPEEASETEKSFFRFLRKACGDDNILQEKELSKYVSKNYESYFDKINDALESGAENLLDMGVYRPSTSKKTKSSLLFSSKYEITEEGKSKLLQILGFKNYLKDYTLLSERESREVELWDNYLIFAALFGIADKVAKELKEINPEYFAVKQQEFGGDVDFVDMMIFANTLSYVSNSSASSAKSAASSGSGGSGSFGGGGGFSGGGSGGGGR